MRRRPGKLFHIYWKIDLEKLIMTNPISDFFTETFDLLSARPFENLVFRPESQGGPNFWKPFNLWVRCRRRFFFRQKRGPIFLEALGLWVRCRRRLFFSTKKGPHISGSPELVGTLPQAPFFSTKRAPYFWARIIRARHGNIWHGTDPPDLGTARHGTSLLAVLLNLFGLTAHACAGGTNGKHARNISQVDKPSHCCLHVAC